MGPTRPTQSSTDVRRAASVGVATSLAFCLFTLSPAPTATAQNVTFHAEPSVALWVDKPQFDRFRPGFYGALRPGISLLDGVLGFQWSYAGLFVPPGDGFTEAGEGHFFTAGVRVRPLATLVHPSQHLGGLWFDGNLGYVRTGDEDRFGFDLGVGYGFQVASWMAVGPSFRYGHIVQRDDVPNVDPNDAQFITLGATFSFGPAPKAVEPPTCPEAEPCAACPDCPEPVVVAVADCPDRDRDGVCDASDRCPNRFGPAETLGCPVDPCTGDPLVVLVQFEQDSAGLPVATREGRPMDPVLDELALAMSRKTSCRVCIIGHASDEGTASYNQVLSEQRAGAVQRYLVSHGLTEARMPTVGQGETCTLTPEVGLRLNRRVEFLRLDEGQSCPSTTACVQ